MYVTDITPHTTLIAATGSEGLESLPTYCPTKERGTVVVVWTHTLPLQELAQLASGCEGDRAADGNKTSDGCAKRQKERVSTQILLDRLTGGKMTLHHEASGRPYLTRYSRTAVSEKETHISISHTGSHYAVALSQTPVGIDIEQWGEKALRIGRKFLTTEERATFLSPDFIGEAGLITPARCATLLWSAKEAAFKLWDERNLTVSNILLTMAAENDPLTVTAKSADGRLKAFVKLCPTPDYALTIARNL